VLPRYVVVWTRKNLDGIKVYLEMSFVHYGTRIGDGSTDPDPFISLRDIVNLWNKMTDRQISTLPFFLSLSPSSSHPLPLIKFGKSLAGVSILPTNEQ